MKFTIYTDKSGEFRWRLTTDNGQIIATSGEGYTSKSDCLHAIELVKSSSGYTVTDDKT